MPKVPLSTITSGYGTVDALNANFNAIEAAFDNTLSRDGDVPNQMIANLDMNGNDIFNVDTINGFPGNALSDVSGYVNTALSAATAASASASSAAATYDLFDDRYLGSKTSNPTVDNDGNTLLVGAMYWNNVSNESRTWNGSAWVATNTVVPDASVTYNKLGPNVTPILTGRNKIINGKMDISQRGTSFTQDLNNFTLDRWMFGGTSPSFPNATVSQNTNNVVNNEFQRNLNIQVTTAVTPIENNGLLLLRQNIEGYNIIDLFGRTFILSFWVRSAKTGTHCVSFRNGVDRCYVATYTINVVNTWEYKTITVSGGLTTDGTWNTTNGAGLEVGWTLAAGSSWQTTAGAWQTGNVRATSAQVNCFDTIGNIFAITGVQLEVGSVATPFEHRPFGAELALCQRYYEAITNNSGSTQNVFLSYGVGGNVAVANTYSFRVQKRAAPTGGIVTASTT
ncbi:MAG: hypothetical protein IM557_06680, partial [Chitinophagaceae bacterium]|nr:hypothetical protein [Chitinophagaceae bacterium]